MTNSFTAVEAMLPLASRADTNFEMPDAIVRDV